MGASSRFWSWFSTGSHGDGLWDMPIIRQEIHQFVRVHNQHRIRSQRSRQYYLPTGRPVRMYNHPPAGVRDYAGTPDPFILEDLLDGFKGYQLDDYLHPTTIQICMEALKENGHPTEFTLVDDAHIGAYLFLREFLSNFLQNGGVLPALEKPLGAMDWLENQQVERIERERLEAANQQEGNHNDVTDFKLYETDDDELGKYQNYNHERDEDNEQEPASEIINEGDYDDNGDQTRLYDDDGIVLYL
ncbi:hypothetical protein BJ508DRAFT_335515 [Ascobolus immersus RN42]|uniref:Uncharacterized protein n=1 Tax=Ascobolus immersus RN42 TaxID=1160509 RepID=A0A3N4HEF2_ASCIM|nr:hypothetical protein BJ508DRAFT_335515 [Ascobolus immersus RN42]